MIEVKNLTKKYGEVTAVDNISFTAEKGRIYGFLGPNGAGKSTTMNIISGCLAATDGEVTINGYDIYSDAVKAKKCIGYLPELPPLYPDMTPLEYLRFVGEAKRIPGEELDREIVRVMELTKLSSMADRLCANLSKGYRQRVGIAQALLGDPEIIILDEPTVGLDPMQIIEIRSLIKSLAPEHTVILSSHILTEISAVCDWVLIISNGRIVASDTLEGLTGNFEGESCILRVESRSDTETVTALIEKLDGVSSFTVTTDNSHVVATLETPADLDIRDDLFDAYATAGVAILSLTSNQASLEYLFIKLIKEDNERRALEEEKENELRTQEKAEKKSRYTPLGGAYLDDKRPDEKQNPDDNNSDDEKPDDEKPDDEKPDDEKPENDRSGEDGE